MLHGHWSMAAKITIVLNRVAMASKNSSQRWTDSNAIIVKQRTENCQSNRAASAQIGHDWTQILELSSQSETQSFSKFAHIIVKTNNRREITAKLSIINVCNAFKYLCHPACNCYHSFRPVDAECKYPTHALQRAVPSANTPESELLPQEHRRIKP